MACRGTALLLLYLKPQQLCEVSLEVNEGVERLKYFLFRNYDLHVHDLQIGIFRQSVSLCSLRETSLGF
jgi:hypothetical protein